MPGSKTSLVDRTPKEGPPWNSEGRGFIDGATTLSDAEIAWKLHQELNQTRSRRFQEGGSLDKHPSVMTSNGNSSAWHSSDNEKNDNIVKPDSDNDDGVVFRKTSSRKGKPESSLDGRDATSKLVPETNEQKRKQPMKPPKPIKIPKLPMVKQGNKWYRARVVQETTTSAQFEFAGYEAVMPMIWLPRNSDRIWFGSYKGKDWRYLGGGAWEPKNKVKNRVPQANCAIISANGCEDQGEGQHPLAAQKRTAAAAAAEALMDHCDHKLHPLTDSPDERVPLSSKHHETKHREENGENDLAVEVVMESKRKKVCLVNGNSNKSNGHAYSNGVGLENGRRVRERVETMLTRDGEQSAGAGGENGVADNTMIQLRPKRSSKRNTQIYNDEEFALEGELLDAVGDPPHPGWYYVVPEGGTVDGQGNPVGEEEKKKPEGNEAEQLQATEPAPINSLQKKAGIGPNSDPGRRRRKPVVSSPAPTDVDRFFDPQQQNKASILLIKGLGIDEEETSLIENVPSCSNDQPDASVPAAIKNNHQPHIPSSKTHSVHENANGNGNGNGKNRAIHPSSKPGRPRKADRILHQQRALNRSFSQPGSGAWGGGVRKPGGEYFRRAASMDSLLTAGKRFGKLLGAVAERLGHLTTNCPTNKDASPGAAWSQHTWVGTDANGSPPAILNVPMELFRLPIPTCTPVEKVVEAPAEHNEQHNEQMERPEGKKDNEESPKEGGNGGGGVGVVGTTNNKPPVPLFC